MEMAGKQAGLARTAGLPLNLRSFGESLSASHHLGIRPFQGARIATGVMTAGRARSMQGPRGFLDMLMLQRFGGMQRVGEGISFDQLRKARIRMESGKGFTGKNTAGFLQDLIGMGGGGAAGEYVAQQALAQLGVPVGTELMHAYGCGRSTKEGTRRTKSLR